MKLAFWCYLIAKREHHLDTTLTSAAAREEGIDMYTTSTPEGLKIVMQLQEDLNKHFYNHRIKQDKYLLSKANLESDAGKEDEAKAKRDIKKEERLNQYYMIFQFYQERGVISSGNQSNKNT